MKYVVTNEAQLQDYLQRFLTPTLTKKALLVINEEFNQGMHWIDCCTPPGALTQGVFELGIGTYKREHMGAYYLIRVSYSGISIKKGVRGGEGISICPGWFGRIKQQLRSSGMSMEEKVVNRLFSILVEYTRHLKSL